MNCKICHQKEHGHLNLCPEWKDEGQDGYVPPREQEEIDEWVWPDEWINE